MRKKNKFIGGFAARSKDRAMEIVKEHCKKYKIKIGKDEKIDLAFQYRDPPRIGAYMIYDAYIVKKEKK